MIHTTAYFLHHHPFLNMNIMKWKVIIVFILVSINAVAQSTQTVRGKILDRQTGLPVGNVVVSPQNEAQHAISNNDGCLFWKKSRWDDRIF